MKNIVGLSLVILWVSGAEARPPQEAIDACRNVSDGSQCVINTPRGKLTGTCRQPPHENQAVCIPANAGRPPMQNRGEQTSQSQGPQGRIRQHTTTQSDGHSHDVAATVQPSSANNMTVRIVGTDRVLQSNGVADHAVGRFPNQGNPNAISAQNYQFRVPAQPQLAGRTTPLGMHDFGLAVNGVPFDPGAAEWYLGNRNGGWQYEPLSGAVPLGIDDNHAHVQPNGAYHYHGLPTLLLDKLTNSNQHSSLVGWAADGFPIYALYGYQQTDNNQSSIIEMSSSYQLKTGSRPSRSGNPSGSFDGTFVEDYTYVSGSGSLDECNGRITVTPEFPQGTYAYFLTESWPVIPRCYKGTPSTDFTLQRARR